MIPQAFTCFCSFSYVLGHATHTIYTTNAPYVRANLSGMHCPAPWKLPKPARRRRTYFSAPVFFYPCPARPAPQSFTLSLPCSQKGPPLCIPDTCVQTSQNILICLGASAICLLYTSPHHCIGTIGVHTVQRLAWV